MQSLWNILVCSHSSQNTFFSLFSRSYKISIVSFIISIEVNDTQTQMEPF